MISADERPTADGAARTALPIAMAALTWFVLLVAAGLVLRLESFSVLNFISLFVVVIMFWPLVVFAPWRDGVTDRVLDWVRRRRSALLVTAGLIGLTVLLGATETAGSLLAVLHLPYRSSGVLFGVALFYRERLGPAAGRAILVVGQWYLELLWLYALSVGLVGLARIGRRWRR